MDIEALTQQLDDARAERKLLDDFIKALEPIVARHRGGGPVRRAPGGRGETESAAAAFIAENDGGPWSPSEVAAAIGKPRGSVSNVLSKLAKAGMIGNPTYGRYGKLNDPTAPAAPGPDRGLQSVPAADDDDIPF